MADEESHFAVCDIMLYGRNFATYWCVFLRNISGTLYEPHFYPVRLFHLQCCVLDFVEVSTTAVGAVWYRHICCQVVQMRPQ
jgi:hypothetical protein